MEPLISEQGISRLLDPKQNCLISPNGYMAPKKSLSERGNVFSFGVIQLELLTGKTVEKTRVDLPKWVGSMVREERTREVFDKDVPRTAMQWAFPLLNMALKCVSHSPQDRPTTAEVVLQIHDALHALEDHSVSSISSLASGHLDCYLKFLPIFSSGSFPRWILGLVPDWCMKFPDILDWISQSPTLSLIRFCLEFDSLDWYKMESDLGKLFIGGISWDTDEERLKEYFMKYGEVVEAMIMRDRFTGRARGFGFIVFADPAVAERVIMDKHMIDGRTVEAKKAVPRDDQNILNRNTSGITGSPVPGRTKKIFVGGLASSVTESDFKNYFDQFGTITDVVVMYDHTTHRPRGFGFITYDSEEAVDIVLHKTFHELKGKLVEVKRAVPKELSPVPIRNPAIGYNYGLSRAANFLNGYAQGYNLSPLTTFGVRMDGRLSPLPTGRSGFPPFGNNGYGLGVDMEPGMRPGYGGSSNFGNSLGYGRIISPYYGGISNRYNTPIGYGVGSGRNYSNLSSATRDIWGNGGLGNNTNASDPGGFLETGRGSFGPLGNSGANWSAPPPVQSGGNASGYTGGTVGYGSADDNYGLGGGGYGRNSGSVAAPASSFAGPTGNFKGSYGDLYRSGSVYGDSTWQSTAPDLDGPSSFSYELGTASSNITAISSEDYVGSYSVASRQSNRGIAA
ncbi:hypothetical protein V6N13_049553 [Hibiscus sabdariffa]